MPRTPQQLCVAKTDQRSLDKVLACGVQQVRVVVRALALRHMADGATAAEAAQSVRLTPKAVRQIARRYRQGGLDRALYDKARPGKKPLLDAASQQRIVALVCGKPPAGVARWNVRLIAEEAVRRKLVPKLGRETVRILLQNHDLKPWREKNVVSG
ncbi:MAG TPA: helix-turn-helix domain-containing protein [Acidobacteriota bacterium]|nr:helix-turn-helix domain-containing protein [Acidobacteriota bacterium]